MIKPRIKLFDSVFSENGVAIGSRKSPTYFDWYKGQDYCDVAVFTDNHFNKAKDCDSKIKVAIVLESPVISSGAYNSCYANAEYFDIILTHQIQFVDTLNRKARMYCLGGCWIEDPKVYEKSKNVSMIFSWKYHTEGQQFRFDVYNALSDRQVDFFGRAHLVGLPGRKDIPEIAEKIVGLRDYRYSIAIENCKRPVYFTEKLIDCFATGTIPIYWGYFDHALFNSNGVIIIESVDDAKRAINEFATEKFYYNERTMKAITDNYHECLKYIITEDWLWNNYFKDMA